MKKESKIWIISEFYYPVKTSTGYYITEIAEFLAVNKNNIHVICTSANYNENENINIYKEEIRNGVNIHRVLIKSLDKDKFLSRIIRLVYSSTKLFFKILSSVKKEDEVLIVTNPAFLLVLMPFLKLLKGIKYKILVHDVFPENLAAIGKISQSSFIYKITKRAFDFAYSQADTCITIGRDMSEIIFTKIKGNTKINLIPNWADIEDVYPIEKSKTLLLKKLNLNEKFIFQFAGNLGHAQGLDNILEAIKLVSNENIHFLFIGSGAQEKVISDYAKTNPLKNVTHIGFQNRREQRDFLNACDVAIVTLNEGMYGLGVPSKSYNIMAAGKPILIIADEKSEISLCVSEYNIGWVIEPNNPKKLSSAFENIYLDCINNGLGRYNSREIAEKYFSKKYILQKYHDLFIE